MAETAKVVVFKGRNKQWFWKAVAKNGEPIASGGEGYEHKQYVLERVAKLYPNTAVFIDDDK